MIEITPQQLWALEDIDEASDTVGTVRAITAAIRANNTDIPRRWVLSVRFKAVRGKPAMYTSQIRDYPPFTTFVLKSERAITKEDVLAAIRTREPSAVDIHVTPDPRSLVGWTEIDVYAFA